MRHIPMLFSTEMVRAILDGKKTQTRRMVKPQPDDEGNIAATTNRGEPVKLNVHERGLGPCAPGDVLWVRETWATVTKGVGFSAYDEYIYRLDYRGEAPDRWRPSIHMPKAAARIFLRVTDVRVGRVRDISREDMYAEGVPEEKTVGDTTGRAVYPLAFARLWDSLAKRDEDKWAANPWVWVIEFEKTERPEGFT